LEIEMTMTDSLRGPPNELRGTLGVVVERSVESPDIAKPEIRLAVRIEVVEKQTAGLAPTRWSIGKSPRSGHSHCITKCGGDGELLISR
jgi:hypothetical protein